MILDNTVAKNSFFLLPGNMFTTENMVNFFSFFFFWKNIWNEPSPLYELMNLARKKMTIYIKHAITSMKQVSVIFSELRTWLI